MERTGIEENAPLDEAFEIARQFLRRNLDVRRFDSRAQRALGLESAAGVDGVG